MNTKKITDNAPKLVSQRLLEIYIKLRERSDDLLLGQLITELCEIISIGRSLSNKRVNDQIERYIELCSIRVPSLRSHIDDVLNNKNSGIVTENSIALIAKVQDEKSVPNKFRAEVLNRLSVPEWERYGARGNGKPVNRIEGGVRVISKNKVRKNKKPLISVITVCWNAEKYIERAINSVVNQTYENVEYIVIDGASTDSTLSLLKKREKDIDYFLSEPDGGVYSAMNKALDCTTGEFVVILNSDDYLKPNFIEHSYLALMSSGGDITYCNYSTEAGLIECPDLSHAVLFTQLNVKHNTFMCSRKCFNEVGYFDATRKVNSDARWIRCAYLMGKRFVKINEDLVFYSTQGLSSASQSSMKDLIVSESASLIRLCFPFLTTQEVEKIYLSNFNSHSLDDVSRIYENLRGYCDVFDVSLKEFLIFNFENKSSYSWRPDDIKHNLRLINTCKVFGIDFSKITFDGEDAALGFLKKIEEFGVIKRTRPNVVLHFARDFSSPSETFIHEFVTDLNKSEEKNLNVFLCDKRLLSDVRAYPYVLTLPWSETDEQIRKVLYSELWEVLSPSLITNHFALNGFWLFERLTSEQRSTPVINICHGIDVFTINENKDYGKYIRTYCSLSNNVRFAAVSDYLKNVLIEQGVPPNKIDLLPNCIDGRFVTNQKVKDFYTPSRALKILNVGRLIDWKGHKYLIESLSMIAFPDGQGFVLTIVYGNMDRELQSLIKLAKSLNLEKSINFIPFVDFGNNPDYYSGFDIFILPSTLDNSTPPRTETFGVSILEAIASGLVVIGTTAGGIPEVIGNANNQALLIEHGSSDALAAALQSCIDNYKEIFLINYEYINNRLSYFSTENRRLRWHSIKSKIFAKRKKIAHFCSLGQGGAAGSSMNIHKELLAKGWDSFFITRKQEESRIDRFIPNVKYLSAEYSVDFQHLEVPRRQGFTMFSLDDYSISNQSLLNIVIDADIINLTWFAKFLSLKNVEFLSMTGIPVVITLRDMYSLTGGCHYFHGCERWKENCNPCPQYTVAADGYPGKVLNAKLNSWNYNNIHFLGISDHSEVILNNSPVSKGRNISVINNFVDERAFYPMIDRLDLRKVMSLPDSKFIIGYLPSFNSFVKGHTELINSLKLLALDVNVDNIAIAILSNDDFVDELKDYEVVRLNQTSDLNFLRGFYNAVDLIVVPSLEETFSNTTSESLFCGTPVAGFRTGVLASIEQAEFVHVVDVGDIRGLAGKFKKLIKNKTNRSACSAFANNLFSRNLIISKYENYFQKLINDSGQVNNHLTCFDSNENFEHAMYKSKSASIIKRMYSMRKKMIAK